MRESPAIGAAGRCDGDSRGGATGAAPGRVSTGGAAPRAIGLDGDAARAAGEPGEDAGAPGAAPGVAPLPIEGVDATGGGVTGRVAAATGAGGTGAGRVAGTSGDGRCAGRGVFSVALVDGRDGAASRADDTRGGSAGISRAGAAGAATSGTLVAAGGRTSLGADCGAGSARTGRSTTISGGDDVRYHPMTPAFAMSATAIAHGQTRRPAPVG